MRLLTFLGFVVLSPSPPASAPETLTTAQFGAGCGGSRGGGRVLLRKSGGGGSISRPRPATNSDGTSMTSRSSYRGMCCRSYCCNSGLRAGYVLWWYRGYRASDDEGEEFRANLNGTQVALDNLLSFSDASNSNSTNNATDAAASGESAIMRQFAANCAKDETSVLQPSGYDNGTAIASGSETTVGAYLRSLSVQLDEVAQSLDVERDIHRQLSTWLNRYAEIEPCLDAGDNSIVQSSSEEERDRVAQTNQAVAELRKQTDGWDQALASSSGGLGRKLPVSAVVLPFGLAWLLMFKNN